ncbi:MAG: DUF3460 family protein [Rhodocyclaceae bacterium]|nr:DUF3460 family protein [Rhodocyclaceae bacterium]
MAYVSEYTQFMNDWLKQHPEELAVQEAGRAMWWDRGAHVPDEQKRLEAAEVPRKAYYYDIN